MPRFLSTKTFGHEIGLSAAFRQWRAESHCRLIHGYALAIKFTFGCDDLDVRNWVVDFGSLKSLRQRLEDTFDHKLLVAEDDPLRPALESLGKLGLADVVIVPATGCERFAELIFESTEVWLKDAGYSPRCWVEEVEVREHGANSAIYTRRQDEPADPVGIPVELIIPEHSRRSSDHEKSDDDASPDQHIELKVGDIWETRDRVYRVLITGFDPKDTSGYPFLADNGATYTLNGRWSLATQAGDDLVTLISRKEG